jgi:protein-tyrosine phosphatase
MSTVLFVCTGNICRSPIAEGLLRHLLSERGIEDISVESAGVSGWEESAAMPEAVGAMHELGIDISQHRARRLSRALIEPAGLVLALSAEHHRAIVRLSPRASPRTFTLKEFVHLLRRASPLPGDGDPESRLGAAVKTASQLRASGIEGPSDQDVADPLGLGLESYRAIAWELEMLCEQFTYLVFGEARDGRAAAIRSEAPGRERSRRRGPSTKGGQT